MLYEVTGDLILDNKINIFCHQTNCRGVMGAGIAKSIANAYPIVREKDKEYCKKANRSILGTNLYIRVSPTRTCVNMYAQYNFGKDKRYTEYDKFQTCLDKLAQKLSISDEKLTVGFPAGIGCGNAGGDWAVIKLKLVEFAKKVKQNVYIVALDTDNKNTYSITASFIGSSSNIVKKWHNITIQILPKSYLVKCGNASKYYSSKESLWSEWICYDNIELPDLK